MVKKKNPEEEVNKTQVADTKLLNELITHYTESEKSLRAIRDEGFTWDERENLLVGVLEDMGSVKAKSKINTGDLVNLILDGACRVMAQFPTGTIQALNTQSDKGKNILMGLIHEKYIIPNADSQYDFLTKLRIWDIYSRVYGSMPALVDYRVDDDYIGPDMWLIHPRAFFPQAGCINISQMAFCQVSTWVDIDFLKSRDKSKWKNIPELIKKVKTGGKTRQQSEQKYLPVNERNNNNIQSETGDFAQCELLTEYRKDRWITYSKDYNLIVRDIKNPQDNNELPIVMKHCFPLLDRLYGLAEFERGHTLQYAANSLVNLYMDGVQMSIFPPLLIEQNGIVASSIEYKAKAKWLMMRQGSIDQLKISPQGMNTFNSTYSFLKSQMLNLGATTDTAVSKDDDPGMGKTPQALKMQAGREGARDSWDRFMMERALSSVNQKFIDLLTTKQEKPISVDLFADDIKKLKEQYPEEDFSALFNGELTIYDSGKAGKINVNAKEWKNAENGNIKFKYIMNSGSTMLSDEKSEHESLAEIMALILKFPEAMAQIQQTGEVKMGNMSFNFGQAIRRYIITSGVQDSNKIIADQNDNPENAQMKQTAEAQIAQLSKMVQEMQQGMQEMDKKIKMKDVKKPSESLSYKDAPESIKRQIESQAGLTPATEISSAPEGMDAVTHGMNYIHSQNAVEAPVTKLNQNPNIPTLDNAQGEINRIMGQ